MTRRYAEDAIQAAIVEYVRTVAPHCLVAAIPNGAFYGDEEDAQQSDQEHDRERARQRARQGARLRWTGVVAGMPDLIIAFPDGRLLWVEVKGPVGRLSPEQKLIHNTLHEMGHAVIVARSIDHVRDELRRLCINTREAA